MKKRILLLTTYSDIRDGWSNISSMFIKYLSLNEYELTVICREDNESDSKNVHNLISVESYYNFSKLDLDFNKVKSFLEDREFDLIITIVEPYLPLASKLKKYFKIPELILVGHGTYIYYPYKFLPYSLFYSLYKNSIDKIIVPSRFTKKKVDEWYKGQIKVINWGIDTEQYYPIKVRKERKSFLFVGELKTRKGIDLLFKAFQIVNKKHVESRLYIVGNYSKYWIDYAKEIGLDEKNIKFLGKISKEDLLKYYSKVRATVVPSRNELFKKGLFRFYYFEGFGLVHLESNACGTPSIGSYDTANEDSVKENYTGLLINYEDYIDLSDKMLNLIEDDKLYSRLSSNSLEHAKNNTWDKKIIEVIRFIEK